MAVYALIAANAAVFLHELRLGPAALMAFFHRFGVTPAVFVQAQGFAERFLPIFTSQFLHVGWLHFGSNMLYLWVFGDNVEDRMGRLRFLFFYLLTGAAAALAQIAINPMSTAPLIGASGAIAGVLGAYLRYFPFSKIVALVPLIFFFPLVVVPAPFFLIFWFFIQLSSGALALVAMPATGGGTAWWAHIGGFAAGFALAPYMLRRPRLWESGPFR